ncbi:MAG TPA: acetolactate decarboxylase [Bacteroidales bacterium]|nr:acetolactate decarboxylase [Bacteroidales bacterium]
MKKSLLFSLSFLLLAGCAAEQKESTSSTDQKPDMIYHYSVLKALDNGVLEGDMKISELKKHGDFGLGTFNTMDGEMIVLDKVVYRVAKDGTIVEPSDQTLIPYSVVTNYSEDDTLKLNGECDYNALKSFVDRRIPSKNLFYAFRIRGEFDYIKCGGASAQEKPYDKSLNEILATRPVYEKNNVKGTLIGFWCPSFIGDINTQGFHLHFLAEDHSIGGHLMEFKARSLDLSYDIKSAYQIMIPETDMFKNATFREAGVNY